MAGQVDKLEGVYYMALKICNLSHVKGGPALDLTAEKTGQEGGKGWGAMGGRRWQLQQGESNHQEALLLGHVIRRQAHDHKLFDVGTILKRVWRYPVEMMEI
jgi:hypothetical protein